MLDPLNLPNVSGAYQLVLYLPEEVILQVGKLGRFRFPAGRYVYTGSARGGLRARVARHLCREKHLRWHIDYLLQHAQVEEVRLFPARERIECDLNRQLLAQPYARVVVRGFGSSDCRCPAHLVYLSDSDVCRADSAEAPATNAGLEGEAPAEPFPLVMLSRGEASRRGEGEKDSSLRSE